MNSTRRSTVGAVAAAVGLLSVHHGWNVAHAQTRQMSPEIRFVNSVGKVPIAYEVRGGGTPALVFVHGWSCDRSYWAGQLPAFADRFTVVALDLGGHGQSGTGRKDWTIESYGKDVAAVVRDLRLRQVILIGHSMGGDVVTEAARLLKRNVIGLIWLDTYKELGEGRSPDSVDAIVNGLRPDFQGSSRALVRGLFVPTSSPALVERVAADMSAEPPEIALPALHSSLSYSRQVTKSLQELRLPVIAINPDNTPTNVESMARHGVEVKVMPGVGHFLMMEDPARLNALLGTSIEEILHKQGSN
jgi:pimeloyl-ACP methyl ester carboxylesterase